MNVNDIVEFRGANRWLSNFHKAPIIWDGKLYITNEHFYQSKRAINPEDETKVIDCKTPYEAMITGRKLPNQRPPKVWDAMKLQIMFHAQLLKYTQHPDLAEKLIQTGDVRLAEGNTWNDTYWGECPVGIIGENHLGEILMEVREIMKKGRY